MPVYYSSSARAVAEVVLQAEWNAMNASSDPFRSGGKAGLADEESLGYDSSILLAATHLLVRGRLGNLC